VREFKEATDENAADCCIMDTSHDEKREGDADGSLYLKCAKHELRCILAWRTVEEADFDVHASLDTYIDHAVHYPNYQNDDTAELLWSLLKGSISEAILRRRNALGSTS
jgi:hypothetical protein